MHPLAADARERALVLVNRYRGALNLKPLQDLPQGVRLTSSRDPICRATGAVWVDHQDTYFLMGAAPLGRYWEVFGADPPPVVRRREDERYIKVRTPREFKYFLAYFDAGFYPDLVE